MTTMTERPTPTTLPDARPSTAISLLGTIRSEWIKFRSVRSSVMSIAAASTTLIASGAITAAVQATASPDTVIAGATLESYVGDPTALVLNGSEFASLALGALGVLIASNEYATGQIRSTFAAVPSRLPVLLGKVATVIGAVLPVQLVVSFVAFLIGTGILSAMGGQSATLATPGALGAVIGTAAFLTGVALIGLAIGVILRATAPAITATVALIFLLPNAGALLLPASIRDEVLSFLPSHAATAFTTTIQNPLMLTPTTGAIVFATWVAVPLLIAAVLIRRRDV
jgi:ABC-2 type transport system permease protein